MLYFSAVQLHAQTISYSGLLINKTTQEPVPEATVSIPALRILTSTNSLGLFSFITSQNGSFDVKISTDGLNEIDASISVSENGGVERIEIEIPISENDNNLSDNSANNNFEDATSSDGGGSVSTGQNVSSVLSAARDPFISAASFGWGQFFYRMRGYDNDQNVLFLNGIPMNDLEEGGVFYNSYSGLNDVMRGRSMTLGLSPVDFSFGGLGLNTAIDASASNQRKQSRLSYSLTNRNYRNRLMFTHSSGLNKNGWAYSFSFSKRWAQKGRIKGTDYDAYAYYVGIEKKIKNHDIGLIVIGAPTQRGKSSPATLEAYDLAGTNYYNSYWGYQAGKIRNSRVLKSHTPLSILTYKWMINDKNLLTAAIAYQFGETSTSTLDWYNAADPRPDYYRYLPSYADSDAETQAITDKIKSDPEKFLQVDWDRLYAANYINKQTGDGQASYILGADVEKTNKLNANVNLNTFINEHLTLYSGIIFQSQKNHDFRRVEDLLGANYWLNVNQFAERTFRADPNLAQLDLNNPNQKVTVGDAYSYNYNIHFGKAQAFSQALIKYNHIDAFVGIEGGMTQFYRDGIYKSGLYQNNSFGKSELLKFNTGRAKAGVTYKLNGRNYFYVQGAIGSQAPYIDNVFVSPRTRNQIISNPQNEKIQSYEIGYLLRSPNFRGRISYYNTNIKNAADIKRYYNDDFVSFANMSMQYLNKKYHGIELGTEIKIMPSLSLNLAATLSQAYYTSRAYIQEYIDNDTNVVFNNTILSVYDTAFIKNYNIPSGPRTAMQANVFYRSKKFWFASLSVNYLADKWLDFSPTSRTVNATDIIDRNSQTYKELIDQIKVNNFVTVDAFFGKSFKVNQYIKKADSKMLLFTNLGLSNVLNNQKIVLYGFENLRTGTIAADRLDQFGPKYAYNLGFQYFLNLALTF